MWARACRIKVGQACHGWNVNSCVPDTWGGWAPHKPCGAGHGIRMQGKWQLCRTPTLLFFVKGKISFSYLLYFTFLCTSLPLFQYSFFLSLTSCSILSFFPSFLCSMKTVSYVRTAHAAWDQWSIQLSILPPAVAMYGRVRTRQVNDTFMLLLSQTPIIFMSSA